MQSLTLNDAEMRLEIDHARKDRGGFGGKGLWFAVNHLGFGSDGTRVEGERLLKVLDEPEWRTLLGTLPPMGLECKVLAMPESKDMVSQVQGITHAGKLLTVIYYGIQFCINRDGHGTGDPRAKLLTKALSDVEFSWPYVCVYANLIETSKETSPDAGKTDTTSSDKPSTPTVRGLRRGFLNESATSPPQADDDGPKTWKPFTSSQRLADEVHMPVEPVCADIPQPNYPTGAADIFRNESKKLELRAKQQAELGDHQTAYFTSAEAMKLILKASRADEQEAERAQAPKEETTEEKVWKPVVEYEYDNCTKRSIAAGWYTESEHLARSMEEQDLLLSINQIVDRANGGSLSFGADRDALTSAKYGAPLTRSDSQLESIESAEGFKQQIATVIAHARDVMETSREASTHSSPSVDPHPPPPETQHVNTFSLPNSMQEVALS